MKLARVSHLRCRETSACTFVWVQDDMSAEEFGKLCESARDAYLAAEDAFAHDPTAPPDPGWSPQYDRHPDKTIAQVKADHEVKQAIRKAWNKKRDAARKPFSTHLVEVSNGRINGFYAIDPDMVEELSWGHRHGVTIDFGETKVWATDVNAPKESDDED